MNWDDLRFVLEVHRGGGVPAAAKQLGVAHTTVYRRIQALEHTHGVVLFERGPQGYQSTPVALQLVQVAEEMEQRVGLVERQLGSPDVAEGEVRVTTVAPLAERLGEALVAFRERYPAVRVVVSVGNDVLDLAKGEADVAIRVTLEPPEQLVGRKLANIEYAVYGAAGRAAELNECDWVCLSRPGSPQARWEASHVDPERVVFRTDARALFVDLVRRGAGVGVLPRGIGEEDPGLVAHSPTLEELTLPVWLLTHPELRHAPRVRAVLDFFGALGESSLD